MQQHQQDAVQHKYREALINGPFDIVSSFTKGQCEDIHRVNLP
jgi:hypothetical protein